MVRGGEGLVGILPSGIYVCNIILWIPPKPFNELI
jgi:hypothetical protein